MEKEDPHLAWRMSDRGRVVQARLQLARRASKFESRFDGGQTILTRRSGDECEVITEVVERQREPSSREDDFLR